MTDLDALLFRLRHPALTGDTLGNISLHRKTVEKDMLAAADAIEELRGRLHLEGKSVVGNPPESH